jgi:predicted AAA+ superfamily ATPase
MRGEAPTSESVALKLQELTKKIILGGWPNLIGESTATGLRFARDISRVAEEDISKISNKRRDPIKVRKLLQSLARNISTEAGIAAISKDTEGTDGSLNDDTTSEYIAALDRLMVV